MTGLVLKLAPFERVLINGVVIENGDRRAKISVKTPNAQLLRLRDAIHPQDSNTPVKRACYVAQLALSGDLTPSEAERQLTALLDPLSQVFRREEERELLSAAQTHCQAQEFYPALRKLRSLIPHEAALLLAAAP